MSGNIKSFSDHEAVAELLSLMRENGRKLEAMVLSSTISTIDNIDRQYSEFLSTAQDQRRQLIEAAEQCRAVGGNPPDLNLSSYQAFQNEAKQVLAKVAAAQDEITVWAKDTVEDFKLTGTLALNTAMDIVGIYSMVKALQKEACSTAWNILACTESKSGQMVSSIRDTRDQGLSPLRAVRKLVSSVNNAVFAAIKGVKQPGQTAKAAQEAQIECQTEKKPSVRLALAEKKAEAAARSASAPEKDHKSKEAAL